MRGGSVKLRICLWFFDCWKCVDGGIFRGEIEVCVVGERMRGDVVLGWVEDGVG